MIRLTLVALALTTLVACEKEDTVRPAALALTEDATGHYCGMALTEHAGPQAQVHIAGQADPLWFTQVRDAVAYLRSPEETAETVAVYVSDMGRASSWAAPGADNWTDAETAHFVIESGSRGGMGAPEVVPFADEADALAFADTEGGRVVTLDEVPDAYVLAPIEVAPMVNR